LQSGSILRRGGVHGNFWDRTLLRTQAKNFS
jgi:hypothetical protein